MRKVIIIILSCILFAACAQEETKATGVSTSVDSCYVEFEDSAGEKIILNSRPQNAAILFASYAQIWQSTGGKVAVTVGDAVDRGYAGTDAVLVDDGSGHQVDIEAIVAACPDFVVVTADYPEQVQAAQILKKNGFAVAQFREEDFSDYLRILDIFSRINENADSFQTLGKTVEEEINNITGKYSDIHDGPSYLFIRAGSTARATKAKTADNHFACKIIDNLGGKNIVDKKAQLTEELSVEYILESQPEVIFFVAMSDEDAARSYVNQLLESDGWKDLDAVKNGRVYFLPQDYFNHKPNSGWADAYSYIEDILYSH